MALTKVSYSMINGAPVSVVDYGADPTGVSDSTAAIQAAMAAVRQTSFAGGGALYFPPGTYIVSDTIPLHENLLVYGENAAIQPEADITKSIFKFTATLTGGNLKGQILIQDLWITGTSSSISPALAKCKHFIEFLSANGSVYNILVQRIYCRRTVPMKSVVGFTGLRDNSVPDIVEIAHIDIARNPQVPFVVSLEKDPTVVGNGVMGSLHVHHVDQSYRCTTGQYFFDMNDFTKVGRGLAGGVLIDGVSVGPQARFGPWIYANPYAIKAINGGKITSSVIEDISVEYANVDKSSGVEAAPYAVDAAILNTVVRNIRVYNNANDFNSTPRAYFGNAISSVFENLALTRVRTPPQPISSVDILTQFDTGSNQNEIKRFFFRTVDAVTGAETFYPNSVTSDHVSGTLTDSVVYDPPNFPAQSSDTFTPVVRGTSTAGTGTYTSQLGSYVKTGKLVQFQIYVAWSAHTGTGNLEITGLPFANSAIECAVSVGEISNYALTAGNYLQSFISSSSAVISFRQVATGGGAVASVPLDTAASIIISGCYMTT
jgi:hypothetical protein